MHTANFYGLRRGGLVPGVVLTWGDTSPGGGAGPEVRSTAREQIDGQV